MKRQTDTSKRNEKNCIHINNQARTMGKSRRICVCTRQTCTQTVDRRPFAYPLPAISRNVQWLFDARLLKLIAQLKYHQYVFNRERLPSVTAENADSAQKKDNKTINWATQFRARHGLIQYSPHPVRDQNASVETVARI